MIFFFLDLCGKEFADKVTLQKHSLVHSTNKPHQCSVCFMSFRHKSSLSRHSKIHSKTTQCHLCHRSFRYESFLKKHLLTAHQDENAINQPHLNTFVKDYRQKYSKDEPKYEEIEELEEEEVQQEECVLIAYDDEQNDQQIIQVDNAHYQQYSEPSTSTVIVNHHSYT